MRSRAVLVGGGHEMVRVLEIVARTHPRSARRRSGGLFAAAVIGVIWTGLLLVSGPASASAQSTVEIPVSFQVTNTDTSRAPCDSGLPDGATYTIRGHISGPQAALALGQAGSITVYLFGYEAGEWNWDLKGVPGYDYATEMARLGHVSLTVDELGYGASDHPIDGDLTCQGALADVAHQIIGDLRSGRYVLDGRSGPRFRTVVLAGH